MLVTGSYVEDQPAVMNIRDEFAKAAMQGILAFAGTDAEADSIETLAQVAYDIAEAMMKQREKRP